jgi:hypothetical protein
MAWPTGRLNFTDLTSAPGFEYLSNQLILNQGGKRLAGQQNTDGDLLTGSPTPSGIARRACPDRPAFEPPRFPEPQLLQEHSI